MKIAAIEVSQVLRPNGGGVGRLPGDRACRQFGVATVRLIVGNGRFGWGENPSLGAIPTASQAFGDP